MAFAGTIPTGSGSRLRPGWTRSLAAESLALRRRVTPIGTNVGGCHRRSPRSALPRLRDLDLQSRDVGLEIVQPQQQRIDPPRLQLATPLPLINQETQVSRGVVEPPAHS